MIDPKVTLHVLFDLHRSLAVEVSLDKQLSLVTRAALALLEADHASIRVLDETGFELLSGARAGAGVDHRPVTFGRGLGVAGWVVDHGDVARIDDVDRDPRWVPVTGQGFVIKSMLAVPLTISGSVIGVLVATTERGAAFSPVHEDLGLLLASVAASPIERARLETIALSDPTTRAFGARYLAPRLAGEMHRAAEAGGSLCVLALEIGSMAEVRAELGRPATDKVLRIAVDRILSVVRTKDVVIRRDGGDIVIVMPQADIEEARAAAERIGRALGRRLTELGPGTDDLDLDASIGIAMWNGVESATRLERRADAALRAARTRGPGAISTASSGQEPAPRSRG